jgi:ADP-L-glycero-D-manno-heptose 6-epimerase
MYIVVTGAAGFIGSNIVKTLNARGETDILAVDNLTRADKVRNPWIARSRTTWTGALSRGARCRFLRRRNRGILHQGACSDTMQTNGRYMMENNYRYSVDLLAHCQAESVPLIYASSASVYGSGPVFKEGRENERPLNVYGYSKFLFDQLVRRRWEENTAQVVGLRYFNVYGPREAHKERMASVAFHCFNQFRETGKVKLFEGSGGYAAGEQRRDFISVEDVVKVNMYFLDNPGKAGIFNCGTGASQTFNDIAVATINALRRAERKNPLGLADLGSQGMIEHVSFPAGLREKYQSYTQADLAQLRGSGYAAPFLDVKPASPARQWLLENAS